MDEDTLIDFVEAILLNLPTFLALGGGILAAAVASRHYPAVALRVVLGCVWLAGVYLLSIVWHTFLEQDFLDAHEAGQQLPYLVHSLLEAIGLVILLSAAFAGRTPERYRPYHEPHHDER